MKEMKEKGITLVSLVVTIIVLLILASISIRMVLGDNGVIKKAKDAALYYKVAQYNENVQLYYSGWKINTSGNTDCNTIYIDNNKLKQIIRTMVSERSITDEQIAAYKGPEYDVYVMNEEEQQTAKQFLIENFENITAENIDEIWQELYKDEEAMKEIIPSIEDDELEKFVIQDGKLKYNPNKVTDSKEREILENLGIIAMDAVILIAVAIQGHPAKIKMMPNKVKNLAVPQYMGTGGVGAWYYMDEEGQYNSPNIGDQIALNKVVLQKSYSFGCFVEGTKISLADGSKKNIEDITYEDKLLVWNFDEGKNDAADVLWLMKKLTSDKYTYLKFDNGAELKIIKHRLFDVEKQEFVRGHIDEEFPIGSVVFMEDGTTAKLVEKRIVNDKVNMYNVITKYHINAFAEGILTSSGIDSLYEIKDMKYQKDERKINKKEDFENIPDKYFEGLRISEWKNTSGEWGKTLEETIQTRIIDLEK